MSHLRPARDDLRSNKSEALSVLSTWESPAMVSFLPAHTVQNWKSLMKEFMTEFYSPGKTQILRNKIATFAQAPTETIAEAYERFNDYIRAIPHHKFSREDVVQKFYQGLTTASRGIIDASAGGSIIELTPTQVFKLFKKVADNDAWPTTTPSRGRCEECIASGT